MGALKAPKVSKIEQIVCWCQFTRLPKLDKVSYFKIFNVINKKAEKTPFLFRIAPSHPIYSTQIRHSLSEFLCQVYLYRSGFWFSSDPSFGVFHHRFDNDHLLRYRRFYTTLFGQATESVY